MKKIVFIISIFLIMSCSKEDEQLYSKEDEQLYSIFADDIIGWVLEFPYVFEGQYVGTVSVESSLSDVNYEIHKQTIEGALRINSINGNVEIANPELITTTKVEIMEAVIKISKGKSVAFSMVTLYINESTRYWGTASLHRERVWDLAYRNSNLENGMKFNVKNEEYTFKLSNNEVLSTLIYYTDDWNNAEYKIELFDEDMNSVWYHVFEDYNATSIASFFIPVELKANSIYTIRRSSSKDLICRTIHAIDNSDILFPLTIENITYLSSNFYNEDLLVNKNKGIPQFFLGYNSKS